MCAYADLDNSFLALKKSSPKTEIKVYPELRFSLRSILLDFQSFTEKPVFESAFAHPMFFFYRIWLQTVWIVPLRYANWL